MSYPTATSDGRCPLCPWENVKDPSYLVHHLAHFHQLHLDRTHPMAEEVFRSYTRWYLHTLFGRRDPRES